MILNKGFKYQIIIDFGNEEDRNGKHRDYVVSELEKIGFNWYAECLIPAGWDCILVSQKKIFIKEKKKFRRGVYMKGVKTLTIEQLKEKY